MRVCRAYGYTPDQIYELDFLFYSVALKELGEHMPIERSFLLFFGGSQNKRTMSVEQRRQAIKAKS